MSKIATVAAIASVAAAQTVLPYTSVPYTAVPATTAAVVTAPRVVAAPAPPLPPRFMTEPGIQVSGYPTLPAEYDFPFEQTKLNTNTGLLVRTSGSPLPPIPNLVKHSDGLWYQAPTNSWQYVGSPLQPYNLASGPYVGKTPTTWALLNNDNMVNLSTGEVMNNPYTPVPQIEVAFKDNLAYAVPRDPFQFMESPFQPYNLPTPQGTKPEASQVPPNTVAGGGFSKGYNPYTIDILSGIQGLPLNYNYNLNSAGVETQQVGITGIPGVPVN